MIYDSLILFCHFIILFCDSMVYKLPFIMCNLLFKFYATYSFKDRDTSFCMSGPWANRVKSKANQDLEGV